MFGKKIEEHKETEFRLDGVEPRDRHCIGIPMSVMCPFIIFVVHSVRLDQCPIKSVVCPFKTASDWISYVSVSYCVWLELCPNTFRGFILCTSGSSPWICTSELVLYPILRFFQILRFSSVLRFSNSSKIILLVRITESVWKRSDSRFLYITTDSFFQTLHIKYV